MSEESPTEAMLALRGDLAALQYKRDRLIADLNEMKNQIRVKDQKTSNLEIESERLREQSARQTSFVTTLRQRVQELEEKEKCLTAALSKAEHSLENFQKENHGQEEKIKELTRRLRDLEREFHEEEEAKIAIRSAMTDHLRRLATALGEPEVPDPHMSQECFVHKAGDMVQLVSRLRSRSCTMTDTLESVETELRSCREALERAVGDRDSFQRQTANHLSAFDRIKQEKEELEIQKRISDREINELRDKVASLSKELVSCRSSSAAQDAYVVQLKAECQTKEEKMCRAQVELRHLLESLAIGLSSPSKFVESTEDTVKARIRELLDEVKDKCLQIEALKEKIHLLSGQVDRQNEARDQVSGKIRSLEEEKAQLESRLSRLEDDFHNSEIARENLRRDKNTFMGYLESLGRALGVEECKDSDVELQTDALLLRAEQLSRMETDRVVDKTSAVYQLQRKLKILREQIQRKDLHLDILRRKLAQQEDNCRARSVITSERDEAATKCKKMAKQLERLQVQLVDARNLSQDLRAQLAEAAELKITALERSRKVEELQARLVDSELLRTRYNRKIQLLKDQVRASSQAADQERTLAEHSIQLLRDDLAAAKHSMGEATRRENLLAAFRAAVAKTLSVTPQTTDYEMISKLEKLVSAHREFTILSRRYEDSVPGISPGPQRTPRYEDSGFIDPGDLDDSEDLYNKRASRLAP